MQKQSSGYATKSIQDYFLHIGVPVEVRGELSFTKSPFSSDKTPSLCIYPNNTFYCWSTGQHGDVYDLVMKMEGIRFNKAKTIVDNLPTIWVAPKLRKKKEFNFLDYVVNDPDKLREIERYANSRGIVRYYIPSEFIYKRQNYLALMFIHVDMYGHISGAKLRGVSPDFIQRFYAKGKLNYYVIDLNRGNLANTNCYISESETSTNSLAEYLGEGVFISFGSVNSVMKRLPLKYEGMKNRYLIIDYDGDEKLYQERLKKYRHLNAKPIKLELPKGEDINSLYAKGELGLYL